MCEKLVAVKKTVYLVEVVGEDAVGDIEEALQDFGFEAKVLGVAAMREDPQDAPEAA